MILKKSSRDPFASLFWNSVRKSRLVPIGTFAILLIYAVLDAAYVLTSPQTVLSYTNDDGELVRSSFFWDFLLDDIVPTALIVLSGALTAAVLFFFAQSKKRCNVVFSLGLSRRKIFLAKYLGGVLPFAAAVTLSAMIELAANLICGFKIGLPTVHLAIWAVATMVAVYTLSFTVVAAVMAFSGNIVEAGIFTLIIGAFPSLMGMFIVNMRGAFTHGAIAEYESDWNFFYPLLSLTDIGGIFTDSRTGDTGYLSYWINTGTVKMTVYTWSGTLTALFLTAVILTVALLTFPKRRNEISGTFGRAKGLVEICGAMTAFYAAIFALYVTFRNRASCAVIFFSIIVAFVFAYLIFKLIFSSKRMKALAQSAKRIGAYAVVFAVVTAVFSTGFFGYATYVPNAEDIAHLEIRLELTNPYAMCEYDSGAHRDEDFGYVPMTSNDILNIPVGFDNFGGSSDNEPYYPSFLIQKSDDIEKVLEIHKALAKEGRIGENADNACGYGFEIEYTLNSGKTVTRYYNSMSLESAIKLLGLSDLADIKNDALDFFLYLTFYKNSLPSGVKNGFIIFSKDLKKCKYIDDLPAEFADAVRADIKKQTSEQIFFHKPEDELGVISFLPFDVLQKYLKLDGDETVLSDGTIYNIETYESLGTVRERLDELGLITQTSFSAATNYCVVVTKSMTNTIKYLTDNNLMQYFKSDVTADDVQKIKFATRAESVGRKNGDMLPLFAAGYACAEEVNEKNKFRETASHEFANRIGSPIKDKKIIQTVLDNALLYGYNGNDDRVVEVTFNDGSIATYAIDAEVYGKLNIK